MWYSGVAKYWRDVTQLIVQPHLRTFIWGTKKRYKHYDKADSFRFSDFSHNKNEHDKPKDKYDCGKAQ